MLDICDSLRQLVSEVARFSDVLKWIRWIRVPYIYTLYTCTYTSIYSDYRPDHPLILFALVELVSRSGHICELIKKFGVKNANDLY